MIKTPPHIKSILVLNGDIPSKNYFKQVVGHLKIIAADAAAWALHDIQIHPHLIIGDLDSLYEIGHLRNQDPSITFKHSEHIKIPDQNTTDFEKALNYAAEHNLGPTLILGLFGNEIDHSLYNLSHLINYASRIELIAFHPISHNNQQWVYPLYKTISLQLPLNTKLSILPMPQLRVSAPTLKWPLNNAIFDLRGFQVRNETMEALTCFEVHEGQGLVIIHA